jgi:acyl CoA:acetate/3-ketoacid CoA transferase beta subunit
MLCGSAAFGLGSSAGLMDDPPADWMHSTGDAASGLLAPLFSPEALLGAVIFTAASVALGLILRAGHIAVALLGAVLWAAGLDAALRIVGDGGLAGVPVVAVAAAAIAVIMEFRRRGARPAARRAPVPSSRPAIGGSGRAAGS